MFYKKIKLYFAPYKTQKRSKKELQKIIEKIVEEKLREIGFFKSKNDFYFKHLDVDREAFISFHTSMNFTGTILSYNPIIGFIHKEVEKICKEVAFEYYGENFLYNTWTESLGYLTKKNEYITWKFKLKSSERAILKKVDSMMSTIRKSALPELELCCNDEYLFEVLDKHKLGLQINNRIKAPILLLVMNKKNQALQLAHQRLLQVKPSQKNEDVQEPEQFKSPEEAWSFFKRDKDPKYYYYYSQFFKRFKSYLEVNQNHC
ncbi:hypothetical protein [Maribacter cobaltidurans]|uniref:Uncharacterized protein n=2 Tax=Maribacter cobaltidurans TaxID=1178778 RepID=A0A223V599_9FLAO|nr:hypothetical protein [Maribacter cobaltidurans]ASV30476.1 hypothetical protein CJ263_09770 [Maribacter cobaltidurans]GGD79029.1 hypothetical protein GCM10011412_16040 [Maribacter cobaltidurans]